MTRTLIVAPTGISRFFCAQIKVAGRAIVVRRIAWMRVRCLRLITKPRLCPEIELQQVVPFNLGASVSHSAAQEFYKLDALWMTFHEDQIRTSPQNRRNAGARARCQNYVVFIGDVNGLDERCGRRWLDQGKIGQKSMNVIYPVIIRRGER